MWMAEVFRASSPLVRRTEAKRLVRMLGRGERFFGPARGRPGYTACRCRRVLNFRVDRLAEALQRESLRKRMAKVRTLTASARPWKGPSTGRVAGTRPFG